MVCCVGQVPERGCTERSGWISTEAVTLHDEREIPLSLTRLVLLLNSSILVKNGCGLLKSDFTGELKSRSVVWLMSLIYQHSKLFSFSRWSKKLVNCKLYKVRGPDLLVQCAGIVVLIKF